MRTATLTQMWPWSRHGRLIKSGNLVFNKTARNFNPWPATAARSALSEVEKIVRNRARLDPDPDFTLPGSMCQRNCAHANPEKTSREKRTTRERLINGPGHR